jgi:hypothetical protein
MSVSETKKEVVSQYHLQDHLTTHKAPARTGTMYQLTVAGFGFNLQKTGD